MTAVATGEDSVAVAWPQFEWSSSDTTIALADSTGVVLGLRLGTATITARLGELHASIAVRFVARDVSEGKSFASMGAGDRQLCALTASGTAYCIPSQYRGRGTDFEMLPGADTLPLIALAGSRSHQCGVTQESILYCWGDNRDAQLMTGTRGAANGAVLSGNGSRFIAVAAAAAGSSNPTTAHTCGIERTTSVVMCAGSNGSGELGRGALGTDNGVAPVANGLFGDLYCWGDFPPLNLSSRLGERRLVPFQLLAGIKFRSIGVNEYHVCGITTNDTLVCL